MCNNNHLFFFLVCWLSATALLAQPNWAAPRGADFSFNATVTAVVRVNGEVVNDVANQIAVFHEGEIRGYSPAQDLSAVTQLPHEVYYFPTVYSNESPNLMQIMVYHAATDMVYKAIQTFSFQHQAVFGDLSEPFFVDITTSSVLPAELVGFTATPAAKSIVLNWTTASEVDNAGFYIERRSEDTEFIPLYFMPATGAGEYEYTDRAPSAGVTFYYRLRQTDLDGTTSFSRIVTAQLTAGEENAWRVYPNPVVGTTLKIMVSDGENQPSSAHLYGLDGRLIQQQDYAPSSRGEDQIFRFPALPPGNYMLALRGPDSGSRRLITIVR